MSSVPPNTVNLARQSTRWSQADSAGGYTMRYITAMRNYLIELWNDGEATDNSLAMLLNHLSNKGFGEGGKGKLRDFLLRSARSAASAYHQKSDCAPPPIDRMRVEDPDWIRNWRECLTERVWRALERHQHANEGCIEYIAMDVATRHPGETIDQLMKRASVDVTKEKFTQSLKEARTHFAQMLADEVSDTLEQPSSKDVEEELSALDLIDLVAPYTQSS